MVEYAPYPEEVFAPRETALSPELAEYISELTERSPEKISFRTGAGRVELDLLARWPIIENRADQAKALCKKISESIFPLIGSLYAQGVELVVVISKDGIEPPKHVDAMATYVMFDPSRNIERLMFLSPKHDVPPSNSLRAARGIAVQSTPLNYRYHTLKDDRIRKAHVRTGIYGLPERMIVELMEEPPFVPAPHPHTEVERSAMQTAREETTPGQTPPRGATPLYYSPERTFRLSPRLTPASTAAAPIAAAPSFGVVSLPTAQYFLASYLPSAPYSGPENLPTARYAGPSSLPVAQLPGPAQLPAAPTAIPAGGARVAMAAGPTFAPGGGLGGGPLGGGPLGGPPLGGPPLGGPSFTMMRLEPSALPPANAPVAEQSRSLAARLASAPVLTAGGFPSAPTPEELMAQGGIGPSYYISSRALPTAGGLGPTFMPSPEYVTPAMLPTSEYSRFYTVGAIPTAGYAGGPPWEAGPAESPRGPTLSAFAPQAIPTAALATARYAAPPALPSAEYRRFPRYALSSVLVAPQITPSGIAPAAELGGPIFVPPGGVSPPPPSVGGGIIPSGGEAFVYAPGISYAETYLPTPQLPLPAEYPPPEALASVYARPYRYAGPVYFAAPRAPGEGPSVSEGGPGPISPAEYLGPEAVTEGYYARPYRYTGPVYLPAPEVPAGQPSISEGAPEPFPPYESPSGPREFFPGFFLPEAPTPTPSGVGEYEFEIGVYQGGAIPATPTAGSEFLYSAMLGGRKPLEIEAPTIPGESLLPGGKRLVPEMSLEMSPLYTSLAFMGRRPEPPAVSPPSGRFIPRKKKEAEPRPQKRTVELPRIDLKKRPLGEPETEQPHPDEHIKKAKLMEHLTQHELFAPHTLGRKPEPRKGPEVMPLPHPRTKKVLPRTYIDLKETPAPFPKAVIVGASGRLQNLSKAELVPKTTKPQTFERKNKPKSWEFPTPGLEPYPRAQGGRKKAQ